MTTKIVTKNSSTASAVPTASDLVQGELAVNVVDKRLFTENNAGAIVELGTNPSTIDINAGTIDGAVIGGTTPAAITGSTVTSTGNIVVTGTVDGRDVATDGTKLDGIEAGADVTDTTNVTAAGALMDSEVTNLAQVKAFDSADYATAAQGTKVDGIEAGADVTDTTNVVASLTAGSNITIAADGTIASTASGGNETLAQTLALGAVTGGTDISVSSGDNIVMAANSTVDGRDVSVDGTKLDGIEAGADVTDTANVTAAGAVMDSELTSIASVKALNQGVATTDSPAFAGLTVDTTTLAVDSTNNRVGIGTASPSQALTVNGTDARIYLTGANTDINMDASGNGQLFLDGNGYAFGIALNASGAQLYTNSASRNLIFGVNETEGMRLDSSGNLLVGSTTTDRAASAGITLNGAGFIDVSRSGTIAGRFTRLGSNGSVIDFRRQGTNVGSISVSASATAYNTSSDQRLKENIADADDAGSKIDAIQVRQYDWKADGSHQDYGMIAQELVEVAPEAVSVPENSEEMMGVDYSKLVPMLVKEIQSLRNRIAALEE